MTGNARRPEASNVVQLPSGFDHEVMRLSSGPALTLRCRMCGKLGSLDKPSRERVGWFKSAHRCHGAGWMGEL